MDWTAPVDIYCERLDGSFWAEPLNAVSNAAFVLAALWAARTAIERHITRLAVWVPIVLAALIGIGSFLFHTFATPWAGVADVLPIWLFVASYALAAISVLGGTPMWRVGVFALIAMIVGALIWVVGQAGAPTSDVAAHTHNGPGAHGHTHGDERSRFNGSEQYFPVVIAMIVFSAAAWWRGHPIRAWFIAATATFMLSLTLRTYDMALCPVWPYGTHVFWHLLNGTMIALLLQALIRNTHKEHTP